MPTENARYRTEPDLTIHGYLRLPATQQRAIDARCEQREASQGISQQSARQQSTLKRS